MARNIFPISLFFVFARAIFANFYGPTNDVNYSDMLDPSRWN